MRLLPRVRNRDNRNGDRSVKINDPIPDVSVLNANGESASLTRYVDGKTLLVFLRHLA